MTVSVRDHYASEGIVGRILAAVGEVSGPVAADRFYPFDQLHGRELQATKDHVARLGLGAQDHVLDIGAGIGGPARYMSQITGARVTGVDLTPEFVDAAREISDICGLAGQVDFVEGNAEALPFDDGAFTAAVCFYVGMNLPNKRRVLAEAFRVLAPGGRLIWTEVVQAGGSQPVYPLPWAADPASSYLVTREALSGMFRGAGFQIGEIEDETAAHLELARANKKAGAMPPPAVLQVNAVVLGPDFGARRQNYIASLGAGQIASLLIEALKPAV